MNACDLYLLHFAGEAVSKTLMQATACGCICVTMDVADAAGNSESPGMCSDAR